MVVSSSLSTVLYGAPDSSDTGFACQAFMKTQTFNLQETSNVFTL